MSQPLQLDLEFATQMHKALGDEARLRILNLIFIFGEICISDLEIIMDFTQTKASRHLTYLKTSGLVGVRRKAQWTFYYLKPKTKDTIVFFLQHIAGDETLQNDLQTYKILFSNRELAAYKVTQRRVF